MIIVNPESVLLREPGLSFPYRKPGGLVTVNRANPINNGIDLLFAPSPNNRGDLTSGYVPTYVNGYWQACEEGIGWRHESAVGGRIQFDYRPAYRMIGDWTLLWRGNFQSVQTSVAYIFGNMSGAIGNGEFWAGFYAGIEASDELQVRLYDNSYSNVYLPNNSCTGNAGMASVAITWDSSSGQMRSYWTMESGNWPNYVKITGNEGNSGPAPFNGVQQPLIVNNNTQGTSGCADAILMLAAKWSRMLSPEEIWSIHSDPYQLVMPV